MICPRCKSSNIVVNTQTYSVSKSRSFLWNLFMVIVTCGIWLIWMLVRKRKEKIITEKIAVCQNCGKSWHL